MARRKTLKSSQSAKKKAPKTQDKAPESPEEAEPIPIHPVLTGPRWLPWQDRFLAQETYKHRPFEAGRGKEGDAWGCLAEELKNDSRKQGAKSMIDRTGEACRARMYRLLAAHRVRVDLCTVGLL